MPNFNLKQAESMGNLYLLYLLLGGCADLAESPNEQAHDLIPEQIMLMLQALHAVMEEIGPPLLSLISAQIEAFENDEEAVTTFLRHLGMSPEKWAAAMGLPISG